MKVIKAEQGYDFLTLYFNSGKELQDYSMQFYRLLKNRFPHMHLQRENFRHLPGDVPHFHAHTEAPYPHFHILYPGRPTQDEMDFIKLWGNRGNLDFSPSIEFEKVS
jgi:hypothetical protein